MTPAILLAAAQAIAAPAQATSPPTPPPAATPAPADASDVADPSQQINFTADAIEYDQDTKVVTATGNVLLDRNGRKLRANTVTWDQKSGEIRANGQVAFQSDEDQLFGSNATFNDDLTRGDASDVLVTLGTGGRLAASRVSRDDDVTVATAAAYTPCAVTTDDACPKTPLWFITAAKVTQDKKRHRIYYEHAKLHFFGRTVFWLPRLSHPDGSEGGNASGLLEPVARYNNVTGARVSVPYYWQLGPNRDLTVTPTIASHVAPVMEARYRDLNSVGSFQIDAIGTVTDTDLATSTTAAHGNFRGYLDAIGAWQLTPNWSIDTSIRVVSDKSFLRLYEYSYDDRLRSTASINRIDADSLLTIQGWVTQNMTLGTDSRAQPIALPLVDYRRRLTDPVLGGTVELQANTLALTTPVGEDMQRGFVSARWDLRRITPLGQVVTLTGFLRGDLYHASEIDQEPTPSYRGTDGWSTRGIVAGAIDVSWPFVGAALGGTQTFTPRVQLVASPRTANANIPDEDSRAIDLDDTDLFALNRFSGYDRWEDDTRVTYGVDWSLARRKLTVDAQVGQSYRLTTPSPGIFLAGTGLDGRLSDIVGRFSVNYAGRIEVTERFRLDKDDLTVRRNEIDLSLGGHNNYITVSYLKLNRDITSIDEDLHDSEEVRLGGRVALNRNWSAFGSSIIDLTSKAEDPTSTTDGFQPVRQRAGVQFDSNCFRFTLAVQRNYDVIGGLTGTSALLSFSLRNLGH